MDGEFHVYLTETDLSGIYRAGVPTGDDETLVAVNVDPAESRLVRIDPAELPPSVELRTEAILSTDAAATAAPMPRSSASRSFLMAALAMALTEIGLAWLFGRGNA